MMLDMDTIALDIARRIEDVFAAEHVGGEVQRRARLQVLVLEAMQAARADGIKDNDPHPNWRPDGKGGERHPQTVAEWDYRNDPTGGALARSVRRLNVAGDYDDPRAPDQMALVLRIDLIRLKHDWIHKNACFEYWLASRRRDEPLRDMAVMLARWADYTPDANGQISFDQALLHSAELSLVAAFFPLRELCVHAIYEQAGCCRKCGANVEDIAP